MNIKILLEELDSLLEQDLSNIDKEKMNIFLNELVNIVQKYKDVKILGKNENSDDAILNLLTKGAELLKKIKIVKNTTKKGATKEELETLNKWDQCEKLLTYIQNKCAISNIAIDKAKENNSPIITKNGNKIQKTKNWKEYINEYIENLFNY